MKEFGSEHPLFGLSGNYLDTISKLGREVYYLRSGRESLIFVDKNIVSEGIVLVPAYSCHSMTYMWTGGVKYYRLNQDLSIDIGYLINLLQENEVRAVLVMNFFGICPTNNIVNLIKEKFPRVCIIEDFSHCTFCLESIFNCNVDYYISSIRKSLGIPDGGIVLSKQVCDTSIILPSDSTFIEKRFNSLIKLHDYQYSKDLNEKLKAKSVLKQCENCLDQCYDVHSISDMSKKILNEVDVDRIAFIRKSNLKHLLNRLTGKISLLPNMSLSLQYVPFSLPILVCNQQETQRLLAEHGIYAPVLWPLSEYAKSVCVNSCFFSEHMLSIPIDQRYDWDDIEELSDRLISLVQPL